MKCGAGVTVALVVVAPAAAWAQGVLNCLGPGAWRNPACNGLEPPQRGADRAEAQFWRERDAEKGEHRPPEFLMPPPLRRGIPSWPTPGSPTKTGPMSLEDLHLVPDGQGGYRGNRPGYNIAIDPDGTIRFEDKPPVQVSAISLFGIAGIFDLTDLVMRLHGDDPYTYDKSKVVELTRKMRQRMTDEDRERRLRTALAVWPAHLEAVWRRSDLPASERRALLFQLWDDLLDTDVGPEGTAAQEARARIVGFIRAQLPPGAPHAYTRDELARLNARRKSRRTFDPYATD